MKQVLLAGALALASWAAQAAPDVPGWRIGAAATFADFDWTSDSSELISDSTAGVKLYTQYQFNPWFAIEGAYHNTGEFGDDVAGSDDPNLGNGHYELSFSGFSAAAIGYLPLPSDEIQFFGKLGYFDFDDELSLEDNVISNGSEYGVMAGIGANMQITDRFGLRLDYDWFDIDVGDLWAINMGIEYHFGGAGERASSTSTPPPPPPPVAPPADEAPAVNEEPASSDEPADEASDE